MNRPSNVVSPSDSAWVEFPHGERYGVRRQQLGARAGSSELGCSIYELPPGKRSFPYHYHLANEEAIYVLSGEGAVRLPEGEVPVRAGDYVALPAGERGAHQVINTSGAPLRYLCVSTMREPDVAMYPDTNKLAVFAGSAPGGAMDRRTLTLFLSGVATVGYWDGE